MWVFFRVEWEVVKKMNERDAEEEQQSLMMSVRGPPSPGPELLGVGRGVRDTGIELFDMSPKHVS